MTVSAPYLNKYMIINQRIIKRMNLLARYVERLLLPSAEIW